MIDQEHITGLIAQLRAEADCASRAGQTEALHRIATLIERGVVGQGVTVESAHACPPGEVIEKFDGGRNALLCGSCRHVVGYRAAVRPTGQEGS